MRVAVHYNQSAGPAPEGQGRPENAEAHANALLAGLLFCQSCQRPMIATYTANGGRRFRYYVCQAARQNGWDSCPTGSALSSR